MAKVELRSDELKSVAEALYAQAVVFASREKQATEDGRTQRAVMYGTLHREYRRLNHVFASALHEERARERRAKR